MYVVYCHINRLNGKRYVGWAVVNEGQSSHDAMMRRWKDHCWHVRQGSTYVFHNSIRKHGEDAWRHDVLEVHSDLKPAKDAEVRLIAELQTFFFEHPETGYNMTRGGDGCQMSGTLNHFFGKRHSEQARQIIKEKRAQQVMLPCTPEKAEKIRNANIETFSRLREWDDITTS